MSLVPTLLQAIVHLDGEALVLHVGEKPYVVSPNGQVDLASRGLTLDAVVGIVNQLLPDESQGALSEFGAAQYQLPALVEFPGERFTVVAARGGDDVWAEIRRRRVPDDDAVPMDLFEPVSGAPAPPEAAPAEDLGIPTAEELEPVGPPATEPLTEIPAAAAHVPAPAPELETPPYTPPAPEPLGPAAARMPEAPPPPFVVPPPVQEREPEPVRERVAERLTEPVREPVSPVREPAPVQASAPVRELAPERLPEPAPAPVAPAPEPVFEPLRAAAPPVSPFTPVVVPPPASAPPPPPAPLPAVVLPLARNPIRPDAPPPLAEQGLSGLDRLLRLAAARGASTLYLSSDARPSVRVDGEVQPLDGAPVLGPGEVESLLLTLMPERSAEALRTGVASEWICEIADVGRVRCLSFRDHRGPGGVFRMMPVRAVTAEQLGLTREMQSLANESGLVIVAGPRSSGKRTLISALIDLINRTRHDHVIAIESEINVVHERHGSFISQREVRGGSDEMLAVARAALREDPDVLVLEELRGTALMNLALDAAASGQLVIGGLPAANASGAIDRVIDMYPSESRQQVQLSLAQNLRGVVAQVLLRKNGGGRLAAREVLLNTSAVRSVLAEGRTSQLPNAIEGGRVYGMTPLNDALVGFVQNGAVDVREAYRRAVDRAGFLALLKRQGLDTSAIEKYA